MGLRDSKAHSTCQALFVDSVTARVQRPPASVYGSLTATVVGGIAGLILFVAGGLLEAQPSEYSAPPQDSLVGFVMVLAGIVFLTLGLTAALRIPSREVHSLALVIGGVTGFGSLALGLLLAATSTLSTTILFGFQLALLGVPVAGVTLHSLMTAPISGPNGGSESTPIPLGGTSDASPPSRGGDSSATNAPMGPVRIRCRQCGGLEEETSKHCRNCGAAL